MPVYVWVAALAITVSVELALTTRLGHNVDADAIDRNLGSADELSYREAVLRQSHTERLVTPALERLAGLARRFLPASWYARLDLKLARAGLLGRVLPLHIAGAKTLGVMLVVAWSALRLLSERSTTNFALSIVLIVVAWFVPDLVVSAMGDKRVEQIERELPDILDQLTISVEAGLGFEQALSRIAERSHSVLSEEFARTLQDIRLGQARLVALDDLSRRTTSDDVRHLVLALRQAEKMGVPLAKTLRVQSAEMRVKRRLRAEEAAHRLPVKMIFPLGLCILPALFIVIIGPAVIQLARAL